MDRRKILTVVGARPQFIKAAPVSKAMAARANLHEVMVHTGQHFDDNMSAAFFHELDLTAPAHALGINGGGGASMIERMMTALEDVIRREKPIAVLVYGDTNSTLAGALSAAKLGCRVAHVEAGLRSFIPMPEETNRLLSDLVSSWLFCPTPAAAENLAREGITQGVHLVGDVMYDVSLSMRDRARGQSTILTRLGLMSGGYQLATLHRAENTGDRDSLARAIDYLDDAAREAPVVLPLHPRTREAISSFQLGLGSIRAVEPVGYFDMMALLDGCRRVLTDSGGLQKEAYFLRRPCVTLRDTTEWPETIDAGWNRLWSVTEYAPRREIDAYGDGQAARRIVDVLSLEL
jgi:UDP-GlcNAc3NAcA epimerase